MSLSNAGRADPAAVAVTALVLVLVASAAWAQPAAGTLEAWNAYAAATEARIARELARPSGFLGSDFERDARDARRVVMDGGVHVAPAVSRDAEGKGIPVPGGLIHHWRGSILLPGIGLDALLERLQQPPSSGRFPADVLAMRVVGRSSEGLRMFIRMRRTSLVTVTYDTEHDVRYTRHGTTRASSRSVATRIVEVDDQGRPRDGDRGFLWRLNAYWRYEQVPSGVIVELESITLSRRVPFGLGLVVQPIADRIARESIARTLRGQWTLYAAGPAPRAGVAARE